MKHLIAGHQTINLGAQASTYLLPVLVSAQLGVTENAYFYTTFMLSSALFFIAPAISNALFAEGAHAPERLGEDLRRAVKYILLLAGPPAVILLAAGPPHPRSLRPRLLRRRRDPAGDPGRRRGVRLDPAAGLAVMRVRHRLAQAAVATWLTLAVAIPSAWFLLPPMGIDGAGWDGRSAKSPASCACFAFFLSWRSATAARAQKSRIV